LPLPWMLQTETQEGHMGAEIAGRLLSLENVGGVWKGKGVYLDSCCGCEGAELARSGTIRGASADIAVLAGEVQAMDADPETGETPIRMTITKGEILGGTQCPFPAFADSQITVGEDQEPDEDDQPVSVPPHIEEVQTLTAAG